MQKKLLFSSSNFLLSRTPSKFLLNTKPFSPIFTLHGFQTNKLLHTCRVIFFSNSAKPISNSHPFALKTCPLSYSTQSTIPPPVSLEGPNVLSRRLNKLMDKLKEVGIEGYEPTIGQHNHLACPMCKGGESGEKSLALKISGDGKIAVWICFRGKCGWHGNTMAYADVRPTYGKIERSEKAKRREITERGLRLEPLCEELVSYFAERRITAATLRRNYVMQKSTGDQIVLAFTYRKDGNLVSCKYRNVNKKFWQEKDTEKIPYGLDDIKIASDIIIVEGEIDKLSMEEAGFHNCVSVPDGAPSKVSNKEVPAPDQDTKYQYLWSCKDYFEKASRIILATDGDGPGQALAEELARRLGKERCWRIRWPKKNEADRFKDANEVLIYLGPEKLKETIEKAEPYPIQGPF